MPQFSGISCLGSHWHHSTFDENWRQQAADSAMMPKPTPFTQLEDCHKWLSQGGAKSPLADERSAIAQVVERLSHCGLPSLFWSHEQSADRVTIAHPYGASQILRRALPEIFGALTIYSVTRLRATERRTGLRADKRAGMISAVEVPLALGLRLRNLGQLDQKTRLIIVSPGSFHTEATLLTWDLPSSVKVEAFADAQPSDLSEQFLDRIRLSWKNSIRTLIVSLGDVAHQVAAAIHERLRRLTKVEVRQMGEDHVALGAAEYSRICHYFDFDQTNSLTVSGIAPWPIGITGVTNSGSRVWFPLTDRDNVELPATVTVRHQSEMPSFVVLSECVDPSYRPKTIRWGVTDLRWHSQVNLTRRFDTPGNAIQIKMHNHACQLPYTWSDMFVEATDHILN